MRLDPRIVDTDHREPALPINAENERPAQGVGERADGLPRRDWLTALSLLELAHRMIGTDPAQLGQQPLELAFTIAHICWER